MKKSDCCRADVDIFEHPWPNYAPWYTCKVCNKSCNLFELSNSKEILKYLKKEEEYYICIATGDAMISRRESEEAEAVLKFIKRLQKFILKEE